jgi:hypothetical protein
MIVHYVADFGAAISALALPSGGFPGQVQACSIFSSNPSG